RRVRRCRARRAGAIAVAVRLRRNAAARRLACAAVVRAHNGHLRRLQAAQRGRGHRGADCRSRSVSRARAVLVLVAAAHLSAFVAAASAQSVFGGAAVADCLARLRARDGTGGEGGAPRLGDVCPDLAREIEAGPWAPVLGRTPAGTLTARPFEDLVDVIAHYERASDAAVLA